jgi:hypothetical protein
VKQAFGAIWIFVTAGIVAGSLTVVFLGMRAVMNVGGSCGSGGPYEIRVSCPGHVAGLMPAAIWAGVIFTGLYVWGTMRYRVPSLVSLIWPALFLSLAYNFFDYGLQGGSVAGGWILCGVIFAIMGGIPLLLALPHLWRVYVRGQEDDQKPWHVSTTGAAVGTTVDALKLFSRLGQSPSEDMTDSLERLDELHKKGALDDLEYAKAKDRVIQGEDS